MRTYLLSFSQWFGLGACVGALAGLAAALFLFLLEHATATREAYPILTFGLPLAGFAMGWVYERWGTTIVGGNNLVIDTSHDGAAQIPLRMAPMVLVATVITHLFGGSAGREGTAVQMGASLADAVAHRFRVSAHVRAQLLAAGIAGGFAAVFGTPMAGVIFGLEVVTVGRIEYHALMPALVAALVGDWVTRGCGIHHTLYPQVAALTLTPEVALRWLVVAAAVAVVAVTFIEAVHRIKDFLRVKIPRLHWRMAAGGVAVVVLWQAVRTDTYLGLGVPTIVRAFSDASLPAYTWAGKLVFTAITLGAGFVGGEVTPLFFVGATLGNALAPLVQLPLQMVAAVCLVAVFGAASNAPLALAVMGVEIFGAAVLPHALLVTAAAYLMTGHRSIYPAQRLLRPKLGGAVLSQVQALRDLHKHKDSK